MRVVHKSKNSKTVLEDDVDDISRYWKELGLEAFQASFSSDNWWIWVRLITINVIAWSTITLLLPRVFRARRGKTRSWCLERRRFRKYRRCGRWLRAEQSEMKPQLEWWWWHCSVILLGPFPPNYSLRLVAMLSFLPRFPWLLWDEMQLQTFKCYLNVISHSSSPSTLLPSLSSPFPSPFPSSFPCPFPPLFPEPFLTFRNSSLASWPRYPLPKPPLLERSSFQLSE